MNSENLYKRALRRVNFYLKIIGLATNALDRNRSLIGRFLSRRFYLINIIWLNSDLVGEFVWFINGVVHGTSTITENTYVIPCVTLCVLGIIKSYSMVQYGREVQELVQYLTMLQSMENISAPQKSVTKKWTNFLRRTNTILFSINVIVIITFASGPIIKTVSGYYTFGEIKFYLPFLVSYPFDAYNIHYWPFVYVHQIWSAIVACGAVFGPDSFYYACCTFIHIQFSHLQSEIKNFVARNSNRRKNISNEIFRRDFKELLNRHKDLMRCVQLLEIIYSKSTLFNFLTSSLVICVTGFNVVAIDDLAVMAPFIFFLSLSLIQIYLLCYYGATVTQSGTNISVAVYDSVWYELNKSDMLDFMFIMRRTQRPCKLTAYGFSEVNLRSFARIMSTAWSYFALLVTMFRK